MNTYAFSIKEALNFGFKKFKQNTSVLIGILVVLFIVSAVLNGLQKLTDDYAPVASTLFKIVALVVQLVSAMGIIRISLSIYKDLKIKFMDILSETHRFLDYMVAYFLFFFMTLLGLILLIFPGVIWASTYLFYGYILIDEKEKPIASLKRSRELTKNNRLQIFYFLLILLGINIIGALLLGVGLLVTIPVSFISMGYVYNKLKEKNNHTSGSETVKIIEAEIIK